MPWSVKANMEGVCVPAFLMDNGEWSESPDQMAKFNTIQDAMKAALNAEGQGYLLGVHITFSGFLREDYKNLPV